ncbi:two-component regulator propeller domain-containing protein [Bernardetia sp.]|uniref:two-component regulator propeller domain-containing protein n=1 Tax=Bernardetia sp. TaxID=1937974 RepID=UPI0025C43A1C|nr:two-component regulator propeller domain-containing protein [Bernardetia sp.]
MKYMRYICTLFFCILIIYGLSVFSNLSFAQFTDFGDTPLEAEHLGSEQGLSESTVLSILQDQKGFMWFGTQDGLNRYDAYKFKIFKLKRGDSTSLPDNNIQTLFESKDGTIWVGTGAGFSMYNLDFNNFINYYHQETNKKTISDDRINAITEDTTGAIWVGTKKGLNRFDRKTKTFERYFADGKNNSIPHNEITALYTDTKGNVWIGTQNGVARYQPKTNNFKVYVADSTFSTLPNGQITCFFEDRFKALWIGTRNGIGRYNRLGDNISAYKASPYPIEGIAQDEGGDLWIISVGELGKFNQNNHTYKRQNIGNTFENYGSFQAIAKSKSGLLWIGTNKNGVFKVNTRTKQFKTFRHNPENTNSLPPAWVWSIENSDNNNLWVGTADGWSYLNVAKDSTFNYTTLLSSFQNPNNRDITALLNEGDSVLWGAVINNGIFRAKLDRQTQIPIEFQTFVEKANDSLNASPSGNAIYTMYKDSFGKIWVGTAKRGLNEIYEDTTGNYLYLNQNTIAPKKYRFRYFNYDKNDKTSLAGNSVRVIFEDRKQNLWIGTEEGGLSLAKRDNNGNILSFQNFSYKDNDPKSISSNAIRSIWEDESGYLWLGTPNGLNRFDPKTGQALHFGETYPKLSRVIHGVLGDKKENLWLSTNNGILKFDIGDSTIWEFTMEDGIQSNEFNSGAYHLRKSDGMMFFGGIGGLTMFHPDTVRPNDYLPPVVLTDFKIFNKSVPVKDKNNKNSPLKHHISVVDEIVLDYEDQVITFEFTALNFLHPENNRYSYRLEGFEENWNEVNDRRFASYTNLPKGEYKFVVRAANNDGLWNNEGASVRIKMRPPYWETWGFRTLFVLAIAGVFWGIYYFRTKSIREQNQRLENSVKERTGELLETTEELRVQRDQLESAYANIRLLSDIGRQITASLHHKEIIRAVYDNIQKVMPADAFGVAIFDKDANYLTVSGFIENGNVLPFHVVDLNDKNELAVKCFNEQREIIIHNVEQEYARYMEEKPNPIFGKTTSSVVYLPLVLGERKMGVVSVQSYKENAFDSNHLSILRNLATYIVIALDNSQAYTKIEAQNREIDENRIALEAKNKDITDSINYAKRIQHALLPPLSILKDKFEAFVLFLPRDIVSGDFYWFTEKDGKTIVAAIDCTGHGVPGAFMSIIAETHLDRIVNVMGITSPAMILNELDKSVRNTLRQNETQSRDGMDMSICVIDDENKKVTFGGAKNPLIYIADGKVEQQKGSIRGIGGYSRKYLKKTPTFTEHIIEVTQPTTFYIFSDGYQDQFGGKHNEKFMKKRFRKVLQDIHREGMQAQKELLERGFMRWKGKHQQIDDVLVIGFKMG